MSIPKTVSLPNGFRLLLLPDQSSLATTVLILVAAGSEYENKKNNGISHFLEHMVFKGTVRRPAARDISTELDALGAEYNAFTGTEYTGYFAKAEYRKTAKIFDLISDLYSNPTLPAEEIEKEKGVIIEEINLYEDTPSRRVHDLWSSLLYGDQPAGWAIAGPKENIRRFRRSDFLDYRQARYSPSATLLVVSGKFDSKKITHLAKKTFGQIPARKIEDKTITREKQSAPSLLLKYKKSDQSHLVLGVRTFNLWDPRRYALQVLSEVLGGGMSSRLFEKLRTEMGAAYYVGASPSLSLDHGSLTVSAGVSSGKLLPVVEAILEEFRKLKKEPVGKDELQKAKDHLTGSLLINLETSDEIAGFYGGQEILTKHLENPSELVRRINSVNANQVHRLAQQIFLPQLLNLAVIGPHSSRPAILKKLTL